jgi:hypothetical protein
MSFIQSNFESRDSLRKATAVAALLLKQFLLRIGLALLTSLAFVAVVMGSVALPVSLGMLVANYLPGSEEIVSLSGLVALIALFIYYIYVRVKTRRRRVQAEAARWLAGRLRTPGNDDYRKWEQRARKWSLWSPFAIALLAFLFLPQTCGLVSHILNPRAGELYHYRVRVPLTWITFADSINKETGFSYVGAWTGKGLAHEWRFVPRLSAVGFGTKAFELRHDGAEQPKNVNITSTRTFLVGAVIVTCWEYRPSWLDWGDDLGFVSCSSSKDDLDASFLGQKPDIPNFYEMLEGVRQD